MCKMIGNKLKFRRTTLITIGLLAFLAGLGFARTKITLPMILIVAIVVGLIVLHKRLRLELAISFLVLGFIGGWWRGQVVMRQLDPLKQLDGKHIVATVTADSDAVYDKRKELSFDASHLQVQKPYNAIFPGKVLLAGFGESAVYKGDMLQVEGKVYASRGSRQLRMSFAKLTVLHRSDSLVDKGRRRFVAGMESALPEPLASFGLGLLIGQRSTLPDTVATTLSIVGLTHIIAVSGYNLTIIMRGVRRMLRGRSKYQIMAISLVLIGLFLLVTGFSASIVRAAIVSVLSLLAWYHGRNFRPILLIVLAAAITAGWNPLYIWSDIGWYLSFLAFFGVLVVAPLINLRVFGSREPRALTGLLTESLCALLMTIPFVLYIFKQISVIALVANLLVVPLVPIAMMLALVAGLGGMIWPLLGGIIAWPAKILLTYILDLVQILSKIPNALVKRQLSLTYMLFIYGCITIVITILWRITGEKRDIISLKSTETDV